MQESKPLFIADSCVGGLSVIKAMWRDGMTGDAIFLADYDVNPLGLKSDSEISGVVKKWLALAEQHSDTLLMACNTLSIRFHQLAPSNPLPPGLKQVISMVDCFEALAKTEAENLDGKRILIIGTEFTASQRLYPDILQRRMPSGRINCIAATDLERKIARFQLEEGGGRTMLSTELERAIGHSDIVILACTCFPMVKSELESRFPKVVFLDPGAYCAGLVAQRVVKQGHQLSIEVTGDVVPRERVTEFARDYLIP